MLCYQIKRKEKIMKKSGSKKLEVLYKNPHELIPNPRNSRTHSEKQVHQIAKSIEQLGNNNPVLIDTKDVIIAGHGRVEAAKLLGLESIPTICLEHLTKEQVRAYMLADNKLALESGWDKEILKIELEELSTLDLDFDVDVTGFDTPEIDLIINSEVIEDSKKKEKMDPLDELPEESEIENRVQKGDLHQLGEHKLYCGDSSQEESYKILMQDGLAGVVFTDPPYNVKIKGNVSTKKNVAEFAMASGEMSEKEFAKFLRTAMSLQAKYSIDGSIHFQCMDWRHMHEMLVAARPIYSLLNLCVWDKKTAGMGSLYRSQHELVFVFKNGIAPHVNNVELGVHGRYRSNVWKYQGMHASNPQAKGLLTLHPTVKPTAMIMDALLDASKPNDIVLDAFGGSGSTLLAAERTKRRARVIELETHYCDVILHRWEKMTGKQAELIGNYKEAK